MADRGLRMGDIVPVVVGGKEKLIHLGTLFRIQCKAAQHVVDHHGVRPRPYHEELTRKRTDELLAAHFDRLARKNAYRRANRLPTRS